MVFSASKHMVIYVTYQGQGKSFEVRPGCCGHSGHTETQIVPGGSQELYDIFYPVALTRTVGALWNACAPSQCRVKRRPISKVMTAAAKPHVVPTIPSVAGALTGERL